MEPRAWAEIENLRKLKTGALRARYQELLGVVTHSSNKQYLFRRIAWHLQARAEGDLSERARRRVSEIADDADIRVRAPKGFAKGLFGERPSGAARPQLQRDWRLPPVGTVVMRQYRGQSILVHVGEADFEYQGRRYRSLSSIAREVTGTRWNGLAFFHLTERRHG